MNARAPHTSTAVRSTRASVTDPTLLANVYDHVDVGTVDNSAEQRVALGDLGSELLRLHDQHIDLATDRTSDTSGGIPRVFGHDIPNYKHVKVAVTPQVTARPAAVNDHVPHSDQRSELGANPLWDPYGQLQ